MFKLIISYHLPPFQKHVLAPQNDFGMPKKNSLEIFNPFFVCAPSLNWTTIMKQCVRNTAKKCWYLECSSCSGTFCTACPWICYLMTQKYLPLTGLKQNKYRNTTERNYNFPNGKTCQNYNLLEQKGMVFDMFINDNKSIADQNRTAVNCASS